MRCLYLLGYEEMTIDEIKRFRQLGSLTPGHPGARPHAGRRNHHRAARPGPWPMRSAWRSPSGTSPRVFGSEHRRSHHLCARLRRRPDGRHQPGSHRARRASEAQQADRAVRRQRHLDRRADVAVRLRRSGEALRVRGLGGDADRRPRSGGDRGGDRSGEKIRPAVADRLPHHHRLRRADQGRQRKRPTARRSAPKRSPARAKSSAGPRRRSKFRPPSSTHGAPPARAASPARLRLERAPRRAAIRCSAPSSSAACAASSPSYCSRPRCAR